MAAAKHPGAPGAGLREQKKRDTQRLLARVGMRLFLTQGYNETTLDQIAQEAEVSRRTIFAYFASKEDILVASHDAGWDDILGDIRQAPRDAMPLQLVCDSLLARLAAQSHQDLLAMRQMLLLSATLRSRGQTVFLEREQSVLQALAQVWPEPGRQWEIRQAAMAAVGAFRVAVDMWREGDMDQSLHALTLQSFAALRKLLTPPAPESAPATPSATTPASAPS